MSGRLRADLPPERAGALEVIVLRVVWPGSRCLRRKKPGSSSSEIFDCRIHADSRFSCSTARRAISMRSDLSACSDDDRARGQLLRPVLVRAAGTGQLGLGADCGRGAASIDPSSVTIPPDGPDTIIDVSIR